MVARHENHEPRGVLTRHPIALGLQNKGFLHEVPILPVLLVYEVYIRSCRVSTINSMDVSKLMVDRGTALNYSALHSEYCYSLSIVIYQMYLTILVAGYACRFSVNMGSLGGAYHDYSGNPRPAVIECLLTGPTLLGLKAALKATVNIMDTRPRLRVDI